MTNAARVTQGVYIAILVLIGLSLAGLGVYPLWFAALGSVVSGAVMFAIGPTAPRARAVLNPRHARIREHAQAFSFLVSGGALVGAASISPSDLGTVVAAVLVATLALAAFTPFCLGRLAFVWLFSKSDAA